MYVRGHVENCITIIDCNDMSLLSMPINALKKIVHTIMLNFTCGLHKMYILNPNWFIRKIWTLVTNFISKETADKVSILCKSEFSQIQQVIDKDQLEMKYGGILKNLEQGEFWPPKNTIISLENQGYLNRKSQVDINMLSNKKKHSYNQQHVQDTQSEYFSLDNDS